MTKTRDETELELSTQFVLEHPRAREFIWWIIAQCGVYSAAPVVNGETGISIGRRVIGVTIINQLNSVEPTAYAQMMIEAHNRSEKRSREEHETSSEE